MFCKFCGTKVEDTESTFCGNCGARLKDNGFDEIVEDIQEDILDDISEGMPETSIPTPIEVQPTDNRTFKDKVIQVITSIGESIQRHKKRSIAIATSLVCLCAIGVGVYFGYDADIIAKNAENQSTVELSKKAKTTQTSQSTTSTQTTATSTKDRKVYDANEFEFITKEQMETDKSIFGESAKSIVLKYLAAVSDGKYHEAYNLLSPSRKEKVGEYNVWVKKFSVFDKRLDITNIEVVKVNENEAVIRYSGIQSLLMYNTNVRANGIAKVIRNGLDISIDEIL